MVMNVGIFAILLKALDVLLEWWARRDKNKVEKANEVVEKAEQVEKQHKALREAFDRRDRREFLRVLRNKAN